MPLTVDTQKIQSQFDNLNDMQKKAVLHTDGPLLILAGAGSGKTTVLIQRIAHILQQEKCKPYEILAITFTNKAAGELKDRIIAMLGEEGGDVWASTFHSFCAKILRREIQVLGYGRDFSIYSTDDSLRVIKDALKRLEIDEKSVTPKSILHQISVAKDHKVKPDEYIKTFGDHYAAQTIQRVFSIYENELKNANALDFDDIILKTVEILSNYPEICDKYARRFKYVMVDEYQDTNPLQYQLIRLVSSVYKNICVVGDDDQSIYQFRGATIENILSFESTFENAAVIRLEQNYRSTHHILEAANEVISNNTGRKGKHLWTKQTGGDKVFENRVANEYEESLFVTDTILDMVSRREAKYSDFAVLYRTNAQSNSVERALVKCGIAYKIIGGLRFYDRKEIRDILAYLYLIQNHGDNLRLKRIINVPKRAIGPTTVERMEALATINGTSMLDIAANAAIYPDLSRSAGNLMSFASIIVELTEIAQTSSLSTLVNTLLERTGYVRMLELENTPEAQDRFANIQEFVSTVALYDEQNETATLSSFLEEISLMTDIDQLEEGEDRVVLMTLHSAKGLEFDNVFIVGVEEGLFPSQQSIGESDKIEEERRLMYVGITRARKRLYLLHTAQRMLYGKTTYCRPSRFIKELPPAHVEKLYQERQPVSTSYFQSAKTDIRPTPRSSYAAQTSSFMNKKTTPSSSAGSSFSTGDVVMHRAFGKGKIKSLRDMGNDFLAEIEFEEVGTKKVMVNFAKLEKI